MPIGDNQPKVDLDVLADKLREGWSGDRCAEFFGCAPGTISKAKRKLGISTSMTVALKAGARMVDGNLDLLSQYTRINGAMNRLLDRVECEDYIIKRLATALNGLIKYKGDPEMKATWIETQVRFFMRNASMSIQAAGELRRQMALMNEILHNLYDMEAVRDFQESVMEIIESAEPGSRERIIKGLQERRALRRAFAQPRKK